MDRSWMMGDDPQNSQSLLLQLIVEYGLNNLQIIFRKLLRHIFYSPRLAVPNEKSDTDEVSRAPVRRRRLSRPPWGS